MQIKRYLSDVDEAMNHKIAIEKRRELAKNFSKPKAESTESPKRPIGRPKRIPLDSWYKGRSNTECIALTAFYLAIKGKDIPIQGAKAKFGVSYNTFSKYRYWIATGIQNKGSSINKFIIENRNALSAAIRKAPSPTSKECKRLMTIGNPVGLDVTNGIIKDRSKKT